MGSFVGTSVGGIYFNFIPQLTTVKTDNMCVLGLFTFVNWTSILRHAESAKSWRQLYWCVLAGFTLDVSCVTFLSANEKMALRHKRQRATRSA